MTGRYPLQRRVARKERFIEHDLLVLTAESAESGLLTLAYGLKRARHLSDAVHVSVFLYWLRVNAGNGAGSDKKILDHLGDQPALTRLRRLPEERTQVQFALRQALQRRGGDLAEAFGIDVAHDPRLDIAQVQPAHVHLAEELFQQVRWEDLADDVKNLVGTQLAANLVESIEKLCQ